MNKPKAPKTTPKYLQENQLTENPFSLLTATQWRFVTAMVENPTFSKKDAAEHLQINVDNMYHWPAYVDEAVDLSRANIHNAALAMRKQAVLKAIAVKTALLDSVDENVRSKAATELIEWELGKANQPLSGAMKLDVSWEQLFKREDDTKPSDTTD